MYYYCLIKFNFYLIIYWTSLNDIGTPEQPLFLAKDVAGWIEHTNATVMLQKVDEDEKLKINNVYFESRTGGNGTWFLAEDGLYEVLMQSRKPNAEIHGVTPPDINRLINRNVNRFTPNKLIDIKNCQSFNNQQLLELDFTNM